MDSQKTPQSLVLFARATAAAATLIALAFGCAAGTVDEPSNPESVGVETSALTACTTSANCSGGQSCCGGFCKNLASIGSNGKIDYGCYAAQPGAILGAPAADSRVPDFSYAGYRMGGVAIPVGTWGIAVSPKNTGEDDAPNIQAGITFCSGRSTLCVVQLNPGIYYLDQPLKITSSNVVLRGKIEGESVAALYSRITSAHALIQVGPSTLVDYPVEVGTPAPIMGRVPVGRKDLVVIGGSWSCTAQAPCDVAVVRTPDDDWVRDIHMVAPFVNEPWNVEQFKISHVRKVVATEALGGGDMKLTLDIPMVDGIEPIYGGGYVVRIDDGGFIENSGVEDLSIASQFDDTAPQDCGVDEDGNRVQCACKYDGAACTKVDHCDEGGACTDTPRSCDGLKCTTNSQCGGGTCRDGKCVNGQCSTCRCLCESLLTDCTAPSDCAPSGQECRDGKCRCPYESGTCSNSGKKCMLGDFDWSAIRFRRTKNSWVRRVTVFDFGMSAVNLSEGSSFNTIEEVAHLWPKSPIRADTGLPNAGHRYSFNQGEGVGNLFQRCYTKDARHSFVTGRWVTGPHVWLDSVAVEANADQGPHLYWATGLLYDNIYTENSSLAEQVFGQDGLGVRVLNAGNGGTSHGWTGAQVMIWNSEAPLTADAPAGGMNWVVGGIGRKNEGSDEPYGIWQFSSTTVKPRSLYLQQLKDRLGDNAVKAIATPEQRNGRLTKALLKWAGLGKLKDQQDDPTCASGTAASDNAACCPPAPTCTDCGGFGLPVECRSGPILSGTRSCLETGYPCFRPDPTCKWGKRNSSSTHCCDKNCTQCGTSSSLPPECRTTQITRSCAEYPAPCKLVDPECDSGVIAATSSLDTEPAFCCGSGCSQCGGTGCGGAGEGCCTGSITTSCSTKMPPCTL